jgi:hypothetical protein
LWRRRLQDSFPSLTGFGQIQDLHNTGKRAQPTEGTREISFRMPIGKDTRAGRYRLITEWAFGS